MIVAMYHDWTNATVCRESHLAAGLPGLVTVAFVNFQPGKSSVPVSVAAAAAPAGTSTPNAVRHEQ